MLEFDHSYLAFARLVRPGSICEHDACNNRNLRTDTLKCQMRNCNRNRSLALQCLALVCIAVQMEIPPADAASAPWNVGSPIFSYCNYLPPQKLAAAVESLYGWAAGYDPTTLTHEIARRAVAGGFNLVWINDLSQLAIAERYGLRAQYVISGHQPQNNLFFEPAAGWPRPSDTPMINAVIDRFKASSAAYSYFIIDEPGAARFQQLAEIVSYIRHRDPSHLAYINLFPPDEITTDLETTNYSTYLAEFIRIVHPALLSYDSYNFFAGNDRSLFLANLQTFAQASVRHRIPFMTIVQGSQFGLNARVPKVDELRFLTFAALAFGAQGISFFNYWVGMGPAGGGIAPFADGRPTTVYTALQALSPSFQGISRRIRSLRWLGTYVNGYAAAAMPPKIAHPPGNATFSVMSHDNAMKYVDGDRLKGVLLGYFGARCSIPACATHLLLQNLDYDAAKVYRVRGTGRLSVFDTRDHSWVPSGHNYAEVTLEPGGGALIATSAAAH